MNSDSYQPLSITIERNCVFLTIANEPCWGKVTMPDNVFAKCEGHLVGIATNYKEEFPYKPAEVEEIVIHRETIVHKRDCEHYGTRETNTHKCIGKVKLFKYQDIKLYHQLYLCANHKEKMDQYKDYQEVKNEKE